MSAPLERRVRQMLINLLSNAVKFTPEGGKVKLAGRLAYGSFLMELQEQERNRGRVPARSGHCQEQGRERHQGGGGQERKYPEQHGAQQEIKSVLFSLDQQVIHKFTALERILSPTTSTYFLSIFIDLQI